MTVIALLAMAIVIVESGGDSRAVRKENHGTSYGPMQIKDICREDINRISGQSYTQEDCFDLGKSMDMFFLYTAHYCRPERIKRPLTPRDAAMVWHYGPKGVWMEDDPDNYWTKIDREMRAGERVVSMFTKGVGAAWKAKMN